MGDVWERLYLLELPVSRGELGDLCSGFVKTDIEIYLTHLLFCPGSDPALQDHKIICLTFPILNAGLVPTEKG